MRPKALEFSDISMVFASGDSRRRVLDSVSFEVESGDTIALVGRSGSGKSTLLHLAAGISTPTSGDVRLAGFDLSTADEVERTNLRSRHVGLIFQFFHLLPHLSVRENVALPGWVVGRSGSEIDLRARDLLDRVGLVDRWNDPVAKLSGGEMQRVAICRALLLSPGLILADEPTGSLDDKTGRQVMDLLLELIRAEGGALLYATHSRELAAAADTIWSLQDGRLEAGVEA